MNKDSLLSPRVCYRINFVGDHKSGKTTIIEEGLELDINHNENITISPNIYSKNYQYENILYKFLIIDTPGHPSFSNMAEMYYNNYDCLVIVIDLANERSFEHLPARINRILELNPNYNNEEKTVFLVGNNKGQKSIEDKLVDEFARRYNFFYIKYCLYDQHVFPQIFNTIINNKKEGKPKFRIQCMGNKNKACDCRLM